MYMNQVVLAGNVTKDPSLAYTKNGTPKAKFGVAVNKKYTDGDGNKVEDVQFINIVVWKSLAELCEKYLVKGQEVLISGSLSIDHFQTEDGDKVTYPYVTARSVQFGRKPKGSKGQTTEASEPDNNDPDTFDGVPF